MSFWADKKHYIVERSCANHRMCTETGSVYVPEPEVTLQISDATILVPPKSSEVVFFLSVSSSKKIGDLNLILFLKGSKIDQISVVSSGFVSKRIDDNYEITTRKKISSKQIFIELRCEFREMQQATIEVHLYNDSRPYTISDITICTHPQLANSPLIIEEKTIVPGLVENYCIQRIMNHVGGSELWEATGEKSGQRCVIKILNEDILQDAERNESIIRFNVEGKVLKKLDHAHIVKAFESFRLNKSQRIIVLEYIEGITMQELIRNHYDEDSHTYNLPLNDALLYICQIAHALMELQIHNILHRDLKPNNIIILEKEKRAILLDLGTAKTQEYFTVQNDYVYGTLLFVPPEYLEYGIYNTQSEIFSLGQMLYLLLFGAHPYLGKQFFPFYSQKFLMPLTLELQKNWMSNYKIDFSASDLPSSLILLLQSTLNLKYQKRISFEEVCLILFCLAKRYHTDNNTTELNILGPKRFILQDIQHLTPTTAIAKNNEKEYIVKFIAPTTQNYNVETLEMYYSHFLKQYQMLSKIRMAYVPQILFSSIGPESSYIITEKLNGITLGMFIVQNSQGDYSNIDSHEVLLKMRCIITTLLQFNLWDSKPPKWWFGKEKKTTILHRNISPANIFLTEDSAYLLGWSKIKEAEKEGSTDIFIQNVFYQAPEYLFEGKYTNKSDMFSLGICLHLWLTGRHPFLPEEYPFFVTDAIEIATKLKKYKHALQEKKFSICVAKKEIVDLIESFIHPEMEKRANIEQAFQMMQKIS